MAFSFERSPIATSPISAVVPAFQAERTLPAVLESLAGQLQQLEREFEVIVVDDGSTDGTRNVAERLAAENGSIKYLRHDTTQGYGAALRAGLAAAGHPLLFTMPADGSYQAGDLPRLLAVIDQVDIVCGYRNTRPRLKAWSQGWLAYAGFGLWLKDVACHLRLYRRSIFPRIPIQSKGCFADVEILAKANFLGCLLTEVEVAWQPPAEPVPAEQRPSTFADFRRVFFKPDFGPVNIETPAASTSTPATS